MLLIPVMYVRGGIALKPAGATVASLKSSPLDLARDWMMAGAELIHIVDLDTPPAGSSPNTDLFKKIHSELKVGIEIEGNIRAIDTAEKYIGTGATLITLGATAYQKPAFLTELCKQFPGKIAVHVDVKRGKVIIKGWTMASNKTAMDYADQFKGAGVSTIFYSDFEEEGSFKLSDFARVREFVKKAGLPVIHTTDISSIHDLESLIVLEPFGLKGNLLSKSIYEGRIDLEGAITFIKERSRGMDEPTYTMT